MLEVLGQGPVGSALLVVLFVLGFSVATGYLGALLGLGGGLLLVPMLVLLFHVAPAVAFGASLVAVIATSSGAAASYVGDGLADTRLGMFLEVATVVGGFVGAAVTVFLLAGQTQLLTLAFVPVVLFAAVLMYRSRGAGTWYRPPADGVARSLRLGGSYYDPQLRRVESYEVGRTGVGLIFSAFAGIVSGLLGVGGGLFYVPAMNTFMGVPMRVAGATSNFMIGVTATAGAVVYLLGGDLALFWTAPAVVGMLLGSRLGTLGHRSVSSGSLKRLFVVVLVFAALLMGLRGVGLLG
jgi:uncharacterized membrane protein YfcA